MGICACAGASMICSFGTAPSTLVVNSQTAALSPAFIATIMDNKPNANIPPFGMCNSVANPATKRPPPVFFTPAPCVPNTAAPWAPGCLTVMVADTPALNNTSKLACNWGGIIQITNPGQTKTIIP